MPDSGLHLRGNLILYPLQLDAIGRLLDTLIEKLPAHLVFLTEVSGQMIAFRAAGGRSEETIDPHALGALIAGDLAASREIARLTGAYEDCQLVLRQGQQRNTLIAEVGERLALLVQTNSQTPLGWARMLTLDTARQLAHLIDTPLPQADPPDSDLNANDFANQLNDSLDSIWIEEPDVR